jgi:hypothetical protein
MLRDGFLNQPTTGTGNEPSSVKNGDRVKFRRARARALRFVNVTLRYVLSSLSRFNFAFMRSIARVVFKITDRRDRPCERDHRTENDTST